MEGSRAYSQVSVESPNDGGGGAGGVVSETSFQKRRCCFCFDWGSTRSPTRGPNWWQRVRSGELGRDKSLWSRGINAFKKIREWSEIVAGPRWKTFIRRFNRGGSRKNNSSNCRYDPLSYALNFDEGPGQNEDFDRDDDHRLRNFSVRYASIPAAGKGSAADSTDGPNFV
ncbi:OLC1v1013068C1 [Oldenlandia corymbosa var. corymbosa]|uniref:OLC1v1013068C1 n=1 Tax=Oldenlandia corymbosa var. corymbosa TaxID=529605 RepID=A0AAV1E0K9_OLDCO|nr:OLC1v1013068C1 [Oldenlandia corymbosa var. corymbosa]